MHGSAGAGRLFRPPCTRKGSGGKVPCVDMLLEGPIFREQTPVLHIHRLTGDGRGFLATTTASQLSTARFSLTCRPSIGRREATCFDLPAKPEEARSWRYPPPSERTRYRFLSSSCPEPHKSVRTGQAIRLAASADPTALKPPLWLPTIVQMGLQTNHAFMMLQKRQVV